MAHDPVTVAASNNPLLETLTAAISDKLNADVNLVDTLDSGLYTVVAPTDAAWASLDAATIADLKANATSLRSILTYSVIPGQLNPSQIIGTHRTLMGDNLTVTGAGDSLTFNQANLVCGGIHTANAVVYMVDTVLMPPNS